MAEERKSWMPIETVMIETARRNLRHYLGIASFRCEADRTAALNCLDVIEQELADVDDLVAVLRSALAAEERLKGDRWEDIASAPKDGTKFDAWIPDAFGGHRMTNLSFNNRGQLRQHGLLNAAQLPRWPTHWMPLPDAPTIRENDNAA